MGRVVEMATKSFTSEYRFTAKTAPKLIQAIEKEEKKNPKNIHAKKIHSVKSDKRIKELMDNFLQ